MHCKQLRLHSLLLLVCLAAHVVFAQHTHPGRHAAAPAKSTSLATSISLLVANPVVSRAHWGISVRTLDGQPVYSMNDGQYFQPASNAKIFTMAAAFALLPPEAVYTTNLVAEGPIDSAGTLHGALTILGVGDPTMSGRVYPYAVHTERSTAPLAALDDLADQVVRAGVHTVEGSVIGDDTWFPQERYGSGWASEDLTWLYGAPVSALTVNDNAVFLNVLPGNVPAAAAGAPVTGAATARTAAETANAPGTGTNAAWTPATTYYTLDTTATFAAPGVAAHPGLDRPMGSMTVRLFGTLPADGYHAGLAIADPAEYAAKSLTEMLRARGVTVRGQASARHRLSNDTQGFVAERAQPLAFQHVTLTQIAAPVKQFRVVASHLSPVLSQDWTVTSKVSQNLHAELVLRTLGKLYGSDGSFAQGTRVVRQFIENAGIDPADFFFYDGSGLSTGDLITPRSATQVLAYAAQQSWGEAYRATLPVGGMDGTLGSRFTSGAGKGHVFAKTGTLNETNALSGYVQAASGKMLAFTVLVNDHSPASSAAMGVMDAIVETIIAKD